METSQCRQRPRHERIPEQEKSTSCLSVCCRFERLNFRVRFAQNVTENSQKRVGNRFRCIVDNNHKDRIAITRVHFHFDPHSRRTGMLRRGLLWLAGAVEALRQTSGGWIQELNGVADWRVCCDGLPLHQVWRCLKNHLVGGGCAVRLQLESAGCEAGYRAREI